MHNALLFIPDISGFTNFVQTTEVEHSQHVIAELLEVLIAANTLDLELAEVEGDALFFYKERPALSREKLLVQVEAMYTAFYGHLKLLEKNRICPCLACSSAIELKLKIVAHSGQFQFLEVRNNRKPFGEAVIQAHRLLKNSIPSDNYLLISGDLARAIDLAMPYQDTLFHFQSGENTYDDKTIHYLYSEIPVDQLKIKPFQERKGLLFEREADLVFELIYPVASDALLELITNYKYRHLWSGDGVKIEYNKNEVTRLGSIHTCVIGGNHFDFQVITKPGKQGEPIYGEATSGPPVVDQLYQFFDLEAVSENESKLIVEIFWEAKSWWKQAIIKLFAGAILRKNVAASLEKLRELVKSGLN